MTVSSPTVGTGHVPGRWQHELPDGRIQCDLCPRACRLQDGQRAFCFVRQRLGDTLYLTSYGLATGFCADPIEKKPLYHFHPGSSVLSFGTAGCNLGCKFCQNWDISKARSVERLSERAGPEQIAQAALAAGCESVAFTYNDPVVFAEFVIDTAAACRRAGLHTVAVTAGYVTADARRDFFANIDAANVDLKAFDPAFYRQLCAAELDPVLDTLRYLVHETDVWVEVTTLIIPGHNDDPQHIDRLCTWYVENLGTDVPLHFTAFHPDHKMTSIPATPPAVCQRACSQARTLGIRFVYSGNVHDRAGQSTYCPSCGKLLIERDWYALGEYALDGAHCRGCSFVIPGRFSERGPGNWGPRRARLHLG